MPTDGRDTTAVPVLYGLWRFYNTRVMFRTARELGEQLLSLAQRQQDHALLLAAHQALGTTLYFVGELARARLHLEQSLTFSDPMEQRALAVHYGLAPDVQCLAYVASTLWTLGYPAQAQQQSKEACTLAQELAHPPSLAFALYFAARLALHCGETSTTHEQAEMLIALATEHRFAQWAAYGIFLQGWALAIQGQGETGVAQMRRGLSDAVATGAILI